MSKVMTSLLTVSLLAIALAATTAHAAEKENSDLIPWTECHKTCDYCSCTKMWPPEINWCSCSNDPTPKKLVLQKENSDLIPWTECHKTCEVCACTKMWPPEINWCLPCSSDSMTKKKETAAAQKLSKMSAVLFPRDECEENCNVHCACSLIYPPPKYCSCADPKVNSLSKKPAAVAVQQVPKVNSFNPVWFPCGECDENCKFVCVSHPIWPPPQYCGCAESILPAAKQCTEDCQGPCLCDPPENCSCATIKSSKKPAVQQV